MSNTHKVLTVIKSAQPKCWKKCLLVLLLSQPTNPYMIRFLFSIYVFIYMYAAAKSLSRVQLCATPRMAAHQAPPSLGFSRQELWSGLPFPSPMRESEKWKWSRSVVSDSLQPHGLQPTRLLHPWDFPGKSTGVGCHFLLLYITLTEIIGGLFKISE